MDSINPLLPLNEQNLLRVTKAFCPCSHNGGEVHINLLSYFVSIPSKHIFWDGKETLV